MELLPANERELEFASAGAGNLIESDAGDPRERRGSPHQRRFLRRALLALTEAHNRRRCSSDSWSILVPPLNSLLLQARLRVEAMICPCGQKINTERACHPLHSAVPTSPVAKLVRVSEAGDIARRSHDLRYALVRAGMRTTRDEGSSRSESSCSCKGLEDRGGILSSERSPCTIGGKVSNLRRLFNIFKISD